MNALRKVLVVDDDPVVGRSFDRVLEGKGYAVIHASGGEEALERLAREDYDVVYTDIRMPGMSGLDVARRVKASRPWLPVVIVTGYGTEANEAEAKELGVAAFLRKPLSPEMIEDSVSELMVAAIPEAAVEAAPSGVAEVAAPMTAGRFAKNAALFLASPFIGLAYVVALPFFGLGLAAWTAWRALGTRDTTK